MNKGTAIVGFLMSFLAGMFLMWGMDQGKKTDISAESGSSIPDQSSASVPVSAKDPQWGNPLAPVTMVVISDFQCPFCSRVEPTLKQLRDKYGPEKLRMVWKNNPLPFHKNARPTAEAAMAVFGLKGNDAFWKFHDEAFANQQALTPENFDKWAVEAGVDKAQFDAALASKKYSAKIDEDLALSSKLDANGTPAFRINGVTVSGAQPLDKFTEVIDAQLIEAQKLIASGTPKSAVYTTLTNKNQSATPSKPAQPKAEEEDKSVWKVPVLDDDPVKGPKDALVTIIEFSDFQCPFCKRVGDTLEQVFTTYGQDVRLVWKDDPLPFHPRAKPSATLARLAYKQKGDKGFWQAHDLLFESNPKLEDADLKVIAEKVGLNWDEVKKDIDSNKFADKFDSSIDLASDVQARGTPHFFINGVRLSGAQPFPAFKQAIDEQLAKAKALVARGIPRNKIYDEIMKEGKEPPPPEKKEIAAPDNTDPVKGGANAKVLIQEFSDFQCPFCKRVEPTLQAIEKEYGNKIKIVWRHMPLPFHKNAPMAAEAAQEVFAQKGSAAFWAFHDAVFGADGDDLARTDRANLEKLAQAQGVDMVKFKNALDNDTHKAKIEADAALGNKAGINGTPAFVINGYYISGAQPESTFRKLINRALKEANAK